MKGSTKSAEAEVLFFYLTDIIVMTTLEELLGQTAYQNVDISFFKAWENYVSFSKKETENYLNTQEISAIISASFGTRRHIPNSA